MWVFIIFLCFIWSKFIFTSVTLKVLNCSLWFTGWFQNFSICSNSYKFFRFICSHLGTSKWWKKANHRSRACWCVECYVHTWFKVYNIWKSCWKDQLV
jgi:hypothetical protein